ncbi:MAG: SDR family oxidoreductase [Candidatus Aminicenantes bacterium]|nr:MAG: SDR family oxidoreductase [Candidatus Aminicenantes bacterium]
MRVLITGITGFAGSHLADYILKNHSEVKLYGLIRWRSPMENVLHIRDKIEFHQGDLKDIVSLKKCLAEIKPDRIFHLAAQSYVPFSWKCPSETFSINAIGQINLFEAILSLNLSPKIHVAGTSEEYGLVNADEIPIIETNPLRPLSTYGVSKVAQDLLGWQYYKSYDMRIIRTRAFNHTGPRRPSVFVCSAFAKQIAEIGKGERKPVIYVGNLEARRDFTDVRDVVRGYWMCLDEGEEGDVYNIGTGKPYSMKEVLNLLLSMSKVKAKVEVDSLRLRPSDVPILSPDCTKFNKITGWVPKIPFSQSLWDLLEYWRELIN